VTLSIAVALSLFISLTVTPMLCSRLLRRHAPSEKQHRLSAWMDILLEAPVKGYARSLNWVLRHGLLMLILLAVIIAINFYLYAIVPKGFFPDQDTGRLTGYFQGDQNISFQSMREKIDKLMKVVGQDPDINAYYEFSGGSKGGAFNTGSMYATLKPRSERNASAQEIVARLRPKLEKEPGIILRLTPEQDSFSMGTRPGAAQYQYTLLADDLDALNTMAPRLLVALSRLPELKDVSSDFQNKGLQTRLVIDREAASHLGVTQKQIDTTLNDAFGQRLVSTIFEPLNQYYVVLTLAAQYAKGPEALEHIYLVTTSGNKIPLSTISHWENTNAPLAVNHQGLFAAATISFNLAQDVALDQGAQAIETAFAQLNPPQSMRGVFAGNANAFQKSMKSQPWLILTALLAVYIVLGMLYESTLHPLTIISTLPSAGVGALLTLLVFGSQFTIIAMIGVILLIGIVMKNAIMMIDAALQIERERGLPPEQAIRLACLQRFRPILMTTSASLLGALPLALGVGDGAELRVPLGLSIVGGLIFSQVLTLYTTPVVYLYLDRLRLFIAKKWHRNQLHPQISST
jgi:multidrug efflux pump